MQQDQDRRGDQGAAERELETGGQPARTHRTPGDGGMGAEGADVEATETDGRGTGGTGADGGGYGAVPGSGATG